MNLLHKILVGLLLFAVVLTPWLQQVRPTFAATTLTDFTGFETGGLEEASATVGSPSVQATTKRTGGYALLLAGAATAPTYTMPVLGSLNSTDHIIGFAFRTNTLIPTSDTDFCVSLENADQGLDIRLRLMSVTGDIDILDANNVVAGTITAPLLVNTWHYIELYYQAVQSGTASVHIDDVLKISLSAKDFNAQVIGNSQSRHSRFGGTTTVGQDFYADDVYDLQKATSNTQIYTSSFNVPKTYQNTDEDATDLGNTLDAGTWGNAGEVPVNAANVATYTAVLASGGTTTDSPSTRLGPTGGPLLGTIKGAKWIYQLKRSSGGTTFHYKRFGNSGDGLTDVELTLTTTFVNYANVSVAATEVPLATESFQYGMKTDGAQDITAADIWAMIANVTAASNPRSPNPKDRAEIIANLWQRKAGPHWAIQENVQ